MCTVTFLPAEGKSYILTSNRDEKKVRKPSLAPMKYQLNGKSVFFPKDLEAGGTWIAISNRQFTVCLLNGGIDRHTPNPPYKKSRGLVVLDFFNHTSVEEFVTHYDFSNIEPFTLVVVDSSNGLCLYELIWNGAMIQTNKKDEKTPHIWSSATLYTPEVIEKRKQWFSEWLAGKKKYDLESIMQFHETGGNGDIQNDLIMNRSNQLLTQSITSIHQSEDGARMRYRNIQENKIVTLRII